jgi:uncharacterized membrane protein
MLKKWLEKIVGNWLIKKGLAKGTKAAATFLVGIVAAVLAKQQVQQWLTTLGITIDPQQLEAGIAVAVSGLLTMLVNYIKVRFVNNA